MKNMKSGKPHRSSFEEFEDRIENSGIIEIGNTTIVKVRMVRFANQQWFDVRKWVVWRSDGVYHPTKKGIFLEASKAIEVFKVLAQMIDTIDTTSSTVMATDTRAVDHPKQETEEHIDL